MSDSEQGRDSWNIATTSSSGEVSRQPLLSWQQQQQQQQQSQYTYQQSPLPRMTSQPGLPLPTSLPSSTSLGNTQSYFLKPVLLQGANMRPSSSSSSRSSSVDRRDRPSTGMPGIVEPSLDAGISIHPPSQQQQQQSYHPAYYPLPPQQSISSQSRSISGQPSTLPLQSSSSWQAPQSQSQPYDYKSSSSSSNLPSRAAPPPLLASGLPQMASYSDNYPREVYYHDYASNTLHALPQSAPSSAPYSLSSYDRGRISPFAPRSASDTSTGSAATLPTYSPEEGMRRSYPAYPAYQQQQPSSSIPILQPSGMMQRPGYSTFSTDEESSRSYAPPLPPPQSSSSSTYSSSSYSHQQLHPHPYMDNYMSTSSGNMIPLPPPNPPPPVEYGPSVVKETQRRAATACNFCRTRKLRCDGSVPCRQCERRQLTCVFQESGLTRRRKRDKDFKDEEGDGEDDDDYNQSKGGSRQGIRAGMSSSSLPGGAANEGGNRGDGTSYYPQGNPIGGRSGGRRNSMWKKHEEGQPSKSPEGNEENKQYVWRPSNQTTNTQMRKRKRGSTTSEIPLQSSRNIYSDFCHPDLMPSLLPWGRVT